MGATTRSGHIRVALGLCALLVLGALTLAVNEKSQSISAASGGEPEMALSFVFGGPAGSCGVDTTTCYVLLGTKFEISVDAVEIPQDGYVALAAWIHFGDDLGDQGDIKADSVTFPDCGEFAVQIIESTNQGGNSNLDTRFFYCATALFPPAPVSFHIGSLYTMSLTCTPGESTTLIELIPLNESPAGTSGSVYIDPNGTWFVPKVNDLTIRCTHPATDTDGDGCADLQEVGGDETLGGLREPLTEWDFYDVLGGGGGPPDGIIDPTNDIFGVIQHYAPTGTEQEYDVNFDRGPSSGPNAWNMTAPDGVIDLTNDIMGVIQQYQHSCQ